MTGFPQDMEKRRKGLFQFLRSMLGFDEPELEEFNSKKGNDNSEKFFLRSDDIEDSFSSRSKGRKKKKPAKKKIAVKASKKPKKAVKKVSKKKPILKLKKKPAKKKKAPKKLAKKKLLPKLVRAIPSPVSPLKLNKHHKNPIMSPMEQNHWESKATFNAAAMFEDGEFHLIYRAIGHNDESVLGYAVSNDGFTIRKRFLKPAYYQRKGSRKIEKDFYQVPYSSGGGWNGGCEDPRIVKIDDKVYLTYTAFDGWGSIRMAMSSIELEDFLKRRWKWKDPVFISPPGEIHKNWVLFPEKIKGKFAILHSISPDIKIDYYKSLDHFDGNNHINSIYYKTSKRKNVWDSWVRGAGPPPIKTKHGWLLLYHAMDHKDPNKYKLGAMLLDLKDPTKIIARSKSPILEPDEHYENNGFKSGVVYCCGAAVKENNLFVYYGGADTVVCVAWTDINKFLDKLLNDKVPKLKSK